MPNITQLPWQSDGANRTYDVLTNLTSSSTKCLTINHDNVTVRLNGYTIKSASGGLTSDMFINTNGRPGFALIGGGGRVEAHYSKSDFRGTDNLIDTTNFYYTWGGNNGESWSSADTKPFNFGGSGTNYADRLGKRYAMLVNRCTFTYDGRSQASAQLLAMNMDDTLFTNCHFLLKNWRANLAQYNRSRLWGGDDYCLQQCTLEHDDVKYGSFTEGWRDQGVRYLDCLIIHRAQRGRAIFADADCRDWILDNCKFLCEAPNHPDGPPRLWQTRWDANANFGQGTSGPFICRNCEFDARPCSASVTIILSTQTSGHTIDSNVILGNSNQVFLTGNDLSATVRCNDLTGHAGPRYDFDGGVSVSEHQNSFNGPSGCWTSAGLTGTPGADGEIPDTPQVWDETGAVIGVGIDFSAAVSGAPPMPIVYDETGAMISIGLELVADDRVGGEGVGTPITGLPWTSPASGEYFVQSNLVSNVPLVFDIQHDNVTIHLNNKSVTSAGSVYKATPDLWLDVNGHSGFLLDGPGDVLGTRHVRLDCNATNMIVDGVRFPDVTITHSTSSIVKGFFRGVGAGTCELRNCYFEAAAEGNATGRLWLWVLENWKIHGNTVLFRNWNGPANQEFRVAMDCVNCEIYQNTINFASTVSGAGGIVGWNDENIHVHDNLIRSSAKRARLIAPNAGCFNWTIEDNHLILEQPLSTSEASTCVEIATTSGSTSDNRDNICRHNTLDTRGASGLNRCVTVSASGSHAVRRATIVNNKCFGDSGHKLIFGNGTVQTINVSCNDGQGHAGTHTDIRSNQSNYSIVNNSWNTGTSCWTVAGFRGSPGAGGNAQVYDETGAVIGLGIDIVADDGQPGGGGPSEPTGTKIDAAWLADPANAVGGNSAWAATGPWKLAQAGATYYLDQDIVCPSMAFQVQAGDITLNLNGKRIFFAQQARVDAPNWNFAAGSTGFTGATGVVATPREFDSWKIGSSQCLQVASGTWLESGLIPIPNNRINGVARQYVASSAIWPNTGKLSDVTGQGRIEVLNQAGVLIRSQTLDEQFQARAHVTDVVFRSDEFTTGVKIRIRGVGSVPFIVPFMTVRHANDVGIYATRAGAGTSSINVVPDMYEDIPGWVSTYDCRNFTVEDLVGNGKITNEGGSAGADQYAIWHYQGGGITVRNVTTTVVGHSNGGSIRSDTAQTAMNGPSPIILEDSNFENTIDVVQKRTSLASAINFNQWQRSDVDSPSNITVRRCVIDCSPQIGILAIRCGDAGTTIIIEDCIFRMKGTSGNSAGVLYVNTKNLTVRGSGYQYVDGFCANALVLGDSWDSSGNSPYHSHVEIIDCTTNPVASVDEPDLLLNGGDPIALARVRNDDGDSYGTAHLRIEGGSTTSRCGGLSAGGLVLKPDGACLRLNQDHPNITPTKRDIRNLTMTSIRQAAAGGDSVDGDRCACVHINNNSDPGDQVEPYRFYDCAFVTTRAAFVAHTRWADHRWYGCTFKHKTDEGKSDAFSLFVFFDGATVQDLKLYGSKYENGASRTIDWTGAGTSPASTVTFGSNLVVRATNNGQPVDGASVEIRRSSTGSLVYSGFTDVFGEAPQARFDIWRKTYNGAETETNSGPWDITISHGSFGTFTEESVAILEETESITVDFTGMAVENLVAEVGFGLELDSNETHILNETGRLVSVGIDLESNVLATGDDESVDAAIGLDLDSNDRANYIESLEISIGIDASVRAATLHGGLRGLRKIRKPKKGDPRMGSGQRPARRQTRRGAKRSSRRSK